MIRRLFPVFAAALALAAPLSVAQTPPPAGYVAPADAPDTTRILPLPPKADSPAEAADRAAFTTTRALAGSPRFALATADADMSDLPAKFACAIGVTLDATNAPTLMMILHRQAADHKWAVDPPKDHFGRPRPFVTAGGDAPICTARTEALARSPSYPSGHSTQSWAAGLILAELAPDRATDILMRARSIGESRVVCGVHYPSDVEEGRTNGSIVVAAEHADPVFRADMDKARAEVSAARATPHVGPEACLDQDQAAAHTPY